MEDGDRTEALIKLGKKVIAVDLNPLSRTSMTASITIVDNFIRVVPKLTTRVKEMKNMSKDELQRIFQSFNNKDNLKESLKFISERMSQLALSL